MPGRCAPFEELLEREPRPAGGGEGEEVRRLKRECFFWGTSWVTGTGSGSRREEKMPLRVVGSGAGTGSGSAALWDPPNKGMLKAYVIDMKVFKGSWLGV